MQHNPSFKHLALAGSAYLLAEHLGHPETTIVTGERYIAIIPVRQMRRPMLGLRYPDLLVAFNADRTPITAATPT